MRDFLAPRVSPTGQVMPRKKREVTGSILPEALGVRSVMAEGCDPRDQP